METKFDIQNPVIGNLLKQINKSKINYDGTKAAFDKAPNPKYLELEERYRKIFRDDDDKKFPPPGPAISPNYLDRFFGPSPPPTPPRTPPPSPPPLPPTPPFDPRGPGRPGPFDNFPPLPPSPEEDLFKPEREKYFPFSAKMPGSKNYDDFSDNDDDYAYHNYDTNFFRPISPPEKITLDENLQNVFPDADRVFEAEPDEAKENYAFEESSSTLERGEIPRELEFFTGGENTNFRQRLDMLDLNKNNSNFVDYLTSEECRDALERDNISIHIDSGDIFINNPNTKESIYNFIQNQQDEKKKELPIDFSYDDDYTDYITKYLPSINEVDDDKFDVLTNKNSK